MSGGTTIALHVGRSRSDLRAVIDTMISGRPQTLLFDTGSVGISVLSNAVPVSVAQLSGAPFQEEFGGGVVLAGKVVSAPVSVSGLVTTGPIAIRLVQSASCNSQAPDCAAKSGLAGFSKSIGADGIFGAGFWATSNVYSPLLQLRAGLPTSIAVHWDDGNGWVKIGAVARSKPVVTLHMPLASSTNLPNGTAAWNNLELPICWQVARAVRTCAPTALDTGSSSMMLPLGFPGGPSRNSKDLPSGQSVTASATMAGPPFLRFVTGRTLGVNLVTAIPDQSTVDSGIQFFKDFNVVFTPTTGSVQLYAP